MNIQVSSWWRCYVSITLYENTLVIRNPTPHRSWTGWNNLYCSVPVSKDGPLWVDRILILNSLQWSSYTKRKFFPCFYKQSLLWISTCGICTKLRLNCLIVDDWSVHWWQRGTTRRMRRAIQVHKPSWNGTASNNNPYSGIMIINQTHNCGLFCNAVIQDKWKVLNEVEKRI